jgi:hypothetical protein
MGMARVYTGQLIHEIANNQTLLYALYSFRQVTRSIVQKLLPSRWSPTQPWKWDSFCTILRVTCLNEYRAYSRMITISKTVSPSFLARNVTEYIVLCVIIGGVYTGRTLLLPSRWSPTQPWKWDSFCTILRVTCLNEYRDFHGCVGDQREGNSKVRAIPI